MSLMNLRRLVGRLGVAALLLSTLWLAGCVTTSPDEFVDLPPDVVSPHGIPGTNVNPFVIQPGEALTIVLSDLPITVPTIEDRVKEDGTISLIQNMTFVAAGKSTRQLEMEIRDRYVPKYYVNMSVSVKQQENTRFFYVGGEVRNPGRQVYLGSMTVLKAVQSAGDFTDFANRKKVQVTRANGKIDTINAKKALGEPRLDLPVYPGDRINVPRSPW